jgi:hypothetical protein
VDPPPSHPYLPSIQASFSPVCFGIIGPFFKGPTGQSRNRLNITVDFATVASQNGVCIKNKTNIVYRASITINIGNKKSGTINVAYIL